MHTNTIIYKKAYRKGNFGFWSKSTDFFSQNREFEKNTYNAFSFFGFYTLYVDVFVSLSLLALIGHVCMKGGEIVKFMIREAKNT
jgi:hypothetical protein